MSLGFHHFHRRRRIHVKHEIYPHPNKFKRFVDRLVYMGGAIGLLLTIPQIAKIWVGQNASGVSILTWSAYFFGGLFWMFYGILHKEKPIIIVHGLWLIVYLAIIVGVFIYG